MAFYMDTTMWVEAMRSNLLTMAATLDYAWFHRGYVGYRFFAGTANDPLLPVDFLGSRRSTSDVTGDQ